MYTRIARGLLLGALLLGSACAKPVKPSALVEAPKPVAVVTADELLKEYADNEIAADQKYKGKLVQISGTVAEVKKAPLLGYYVGLGSARDGEMFDVMCYLAESAVDDASKLKKGEAASLMGICEGKALGVVLRFKGCEVVK